MVTWIKVKIFDLIEALKIKERFPTFSSLDYKIKKQYKGMNPYRLAKRYGRVYGETPLTTMFEIAKLCKLTSEDHLYELGGGRGRAALFLNHIFGCKVTVFEEVEEFVRIGRRLSKSLKVNFKRENFLDSKLSSPCCIYLYGTCMSDDEIKSLIKNIPKKARVISVSFPLSDYDDRFNVVEKIEGRFPWGKTDIYYSVLN